MNAVSLKYKHCLYRHTAHRTRYTSKVHCKGNELIPITPSPQQWIC